MLNNGEISAFMNYYVIFICNFGIKMDLSVTIVLLNIRKTNTLRSRRRNKDFA